jgi:hypothetical protein
MYPDPACGRQVGTDRRPIRIVYVSRNQPRSTDCIAALISARAANCSVVFIP